MRIAVIAPPWLAVPPAAYGGTELVLDSLCRGLRASGHDVLLYATGDSTCPVERAWTYDTHLGVDRANPVAELRHVLDAYEAAAAWGADVVHDHTIVGPAWSHVHANVPVVTTNHGPFDEQLGPIYRRIAHHVPLIAISHHQASTAGEVPVRAVIHHGIDTEAVRQGSGQGGFALFLGRMSPDKGVGAAVDAARKAGLRLVIAAKMREPDERDYFTAVIEPRLGRDVEYVGEVGGDEKDRLLRSATCLLNPIAWPEPFGMVMIEALAVGTPVVTTRCGAAPEIVDDGVTGYLCDGPGALAAAIPAAAKLDRDACRRAAAERFSMGRMASDHAALYQSLLADHRDGADELERMLDREPARRTDLAAT